MNPKGLKKDEYDAIIIGAGIGGLVCGCYLAKAGMKVLIVEQHSQPGGYCSSFKRKGFTFDVGVHSLGSCRPEGFIGCVIDELGVRRDLALLRSDPSDVIITLKNKFCIYNNIEKTIAHFQEKFPKEANSIQRFFTFVSNPNKNYFRLFLELKDKTFEDLLDEYFKNKELKEVLGIIPGVTAGVPASMGAAFTLTLLYNEFILDGGYYPSGGIQSFPNTLVEKFKRLGGAISLSAKAEQILVENGAVKGVLLHNSLFLKSNIAVSNCDLKRTFFNLIDEKYLNKNALNKIRKLKPSVSAFVVYLGLNRKLENGNFNYNLWHCTEQKVDGLYSNVCHNKLDLNVTNFLATSQSGKDPSLAPAGKESLYLLITCPTKTSNFWLKNRTRIQDNVINRARAFIPDISNIIETVHSATPETFEHFTSNNKGAIYGWRATTEQVGKIALSQENLIKGLFLTGHWTSQGHGIPNVTFAGRNTAKIILNKHLSN